MTSNCTAIAPGKPVKPWQQFGLNLASRIYGGRDVVMAIDLTESVGLNAEGRLRLTQIIEDSLQSGDTIYVLPFASQVSPLQSDAARSWGSPPGATASRSDRNPLTLQQGINTKSINVCDR